MTLGIFNRAIRNISRRKIRALLVIIALGFSMAIMLAIPAGVYANQAQVDSLSNSLNNTINQTSASINQTLTQLDCSLASDMSGFGFSRANFTTGESSGQFPRPSGENTGFDPSQFGGGTAPGEFGGGSFGGGRAEPMNQSLYTDISSISGVAAVAPLLSASEGHNSTSSMFGRTFTRLISDYVIEGVPLTSGLVENYPVLPTNITEGRNLQAGDSGVVLLSENNSAYFDADVGDTITILDHSFTVVGIHGTSDVSAGLILYMNLSDAQLITNNTGFITSIEVFAQDSSLVNQVSSSITSAHSELTVTTGQQRLEQLQQLQSSYNTALQNAETSISQTQTTAVEEIIVVVAATSLIVLFVMLYTVRERTKEIGTLKAIGFSNATVMAQFMIEGVMLSLLAGVIGIAIGYFAAPSLAGLLQLTAVTNSLGFRAATSSTTSSVSISPELVLIVFGAAIALGAIGSLYPAWRAAKIKPAEAMKYE
jgi:putative ABC transport system permease protein